MSRADVTSPPTRLTPAVRASSASPAAKSRTQLNSQVGGAEKPTSRLVARAPIASRSATFTATALRPTSRAADQSVRKCTPSIKHVEGHGDRAVGGQHGGVVTRPEQDARRPRAGRP